MPIKVEDMSGGSRLPERIGRLEELANNLWWSWHPQARDLFRALDYPLWRLGGHNPVKQLREISTDKLEEAAAKPQQFRVKTSFHIPVMLHRPNNIGSALILTSPVPQWGWS